MQCAPHITLIFSLHDRANPQDTIGSTRRCAERAKLHLEGLVQDMWQERETRDSEYSALLHEARGLCCALVRVLKRSRGWRREQAVAWRASEPKDATTSWLWIIHGHTASVHAVDLPSTWARAQHVCKNREPTLAACLLHSMSREKELFHLTTFVTFADHASSDGNSASELRLTHHCQHTTLC